METFAKLFERILDRRLNQAKRRRARRFQPIRVLLPPSGDGTLSGRREKDQSVGADHCVFPMSLALALGFDALCMPSQLVGGLGNSGNLTYYESIEIDLGDGMLFRTIAGFTRALDGQRLGILGKAGFFENFKVTFDYASQLFHIDTGRRPAK